VNLNTVADSAARDRSNTDLTMTTASRDCSGLQPAWCASRTCAGVLLMLFIAIGTSGCSLRAAPSFVLFGAYFPAWLLLGLIAILVAVVARAAFVATGLGNVVPFQLLVCVSVGVTAAVLAWLIWFAA
jgi:hypothetical protein